MNTKKEYDESLLYTGFLDFLRPFSCQSTFGSTALTRIPTLSGAGSPMKQSRRASTSRSRTVSCSCRSKRRNKQARIMCSSASARLDVLRHVRSLCVCVCVCVTGREGEQLTSNRRTCGYRAQRARRLGSYGLSPNSRRTSAQVENRGD